MMSSKEKKILILMADDAGKGCLTLLFSARDAQCNQAVALRQYLLSRLEKKTA
jgi:uncharacterized protein YeaO (DUF488 family)